MWWRRNCNRTFQFINGFLVWTVPISGGGGALSPWALLLCTRGRILLVNVYIIHLECGVQVPTTNFFGQAEKEEDEAEVSRWEAPAPFKIEDIITINSDRERCHDASSEQWSRDELFVKSLSGHPFSHDGVAVRTMGEDPSCC